jgi:hypothetical protein
MGIAPMSKTSASVAAAEDEDAEALVELLPVSSQIKHFLAGHTTGRALLHALYDDVLDEPVPPRLTTILRGRL